MNIILYIKQAFSAIKSNKLRSFLSTLWIIIWILSFVIMLAIWEWAKREILSFYAKYANVITVYNRWFYWNEAKKEAKNIFTKEIIYEIGEKVPDVKNVLIEYSQKNLSVIYNWKNFENFWIIPVDKNFFEIKEAKKILWTYFWEDDFKENNKNAIIWYKLVKKNFWDENPIWKKIIIWWEIFIISGVLDENDYSIDRSIFIPISTSKKYFWSSDINTFFVYSFDEKVVPQVEKDLKYFLLKKSWLEEIKDASFEVYSNKEAKNEAEKSSNWFTYFLMFIGWISLLVWWIWIMNIMLVSVTERTREIWIRKAIWATNFTIMLQFLIESIILTLVWSSIAIALSYWIAAVIRTYAEWDFYIFKNIYIDTNVLLLAISVSVSMWIIFWLMPAYKAAKLKIIDALYFE